MDRRAFLRNAGIAAAAAPVLFTSRARGANDRIRTAVIGMGGRGRDHMNALAGLEGVEVATFCDPDETRMSALAAAFEAQTGRRPELQADVRRVLDDRNIDAITIAAPNHWHALATVWACQAGKHVYVEKPVAHEMAAGRMMVEAARKYNRVVQGGTQRRSSPTIRRAMAAIHDGIIGDVYMARCIHFQERPSLGFKEAETPPASLHWDLWLGPGPAQPFHRNLVHYNWHWFWDFGNGELGNNGVHCMDLARWGMKKELPATIHASGGRFGYKDQGQTPNTMVAAYEFADGTEIVCDIRGRFSNPEGGMSEGVFFYGSKGYLSIANQGPRVQLFRAGSSEPDADFGKAMEPDPKTNLDILHFGNFFDAVRAGTSKALHAEINETWLSTALCLLGNISYRVGRKLTLDNEQERFAGDDEADRLLSQDYRHPFTMPGKV